MCGENHAATNSRAAAGSVGMGESCSDGCYALVSSLYKGESARRLGGSSLASVSANNPGVDAGARVTEEIGPSIMNASTCQNNATASVSVDEVVAQLVEAGFPLFRIHDVMKKVDIDRAHDVSFLVDTLLCEWEQTTEIIEPAIVRDCPECCDEAVAEAGDEALDIQRGHGHSHQISDPFLQVLLPEDAANHQNSTVLPRSESVSVLGDSSFGIIDETVKDTLLGMGFDVVQVHAVLEQGAVNAPERVERALELLLKAAPGINETPQLETNAEPVPPPSVPACPTLERNLSETSKNVLAKALSNQGHDQQRRIIRLLLETKSAMQQKLLNFEMRSQLHDYLVEGQLDVVHDILRASGLREAPEMILAEGEAHWECAICFTEQDTFGWACTDQHRFCADCMRHHVDSVAMPRCPQPGCKYVLDEDDLLFLDVPHARLEAFRTHILQGALDLVVEGEETLLRCPQQDCGNVVILPAGKGRVRFECHCGSPAFCTSCRQTPYHYHAGCGYVQPLRERWIAWVEASNKRAELLRDASRAHEELMADERWKAANCRLCPNCKRPVSKVEGCDSMICGRAFHGGDAQPGCGREFDWARATRYKAVETRRRFIPESSAQIRTRGRSAFHPLATCSICNCRGIHGLRFRCIHCESFNVCSTCEPQLAGHHDPSHVFEIMVETGIRWTNLPRQTRVKLVRDGDKLPQSWARSKPSGSTASVDGARRHVACRVTTAVSRPHSLPTLELEGKNGIIVGQWEGSPDGYRVRLDGSTIHVDVPVEHVEPILRTPQGARHLLKQCKSAPAQRFSNDLYHILPTPTPPPTPLIISERNSTERRGAGRGRGRGVGRGQASSSANTSERPIWR